MSQKVNVKLILVCASTTCERHSSDSKYPNIYSEISDKTDLNEYMCGRFNRTGISCSKCAFELQ